MHGHLSPACWNLACEAKVPIRAHSRKRSITGAYSRPNMLYMHAKIRERKAARKTKLSRAEAHNERSALLAKFHTLPAEEREPFETKAKIQNMRRKTEKSHGSQCNDPDLQYGIAVGDSLWGVVFQGAADSARSHRT